MTDPRTTRLVHLACRQAGTLLGAACLAVALAPAASAAEDRCPNAAIRAQQDVKQLPDCRAYEQVSPADKDGKVVKDYADLQPEPASAAEDGNAAAFQVQGGIGDAQSSLTQVDVVARRLADGWSSHAVTDKRYLDICCKTIVRGWSGDLAQAAVETGPGPALAPGAIEGAATNLYRYDLSSRSYRTAVHDSFFVGGSSDLSTMVFQSYVTLTGDAPAFVDNPYAWRDGQLKLVSILPDPDGPGPLAAQPASGGAAIPRGSALGDFNAVSQDGSRIVFATPDGRLYVRIDGARTVEVSASQRAIPDSQQPATYATATPDGSAVLFATAEQLLDSDTDADTDVYRYAVDTGELIRISGSVPGGAMTVADVNDDGSYAYFASSGAVYVWHDGVTRLVSDFHPTASSTVDADQWRARVSEDGTGAVFGGSAVWYYDYRQDKLTCASCGPSGTGQNEGATLPAAYDGPPRVRPRSISADGRRVFFTTPVPLVAADTNGQRDVYEYSGGEARLISSGRGRNGAKLISISADGRDVFFTTNERLTSSDIDEGRDLYDARVGGGFAAPPPPPVACADDACQGVAATPAAPVGIGSIALTEAVDEPMPVRSALAKVSVARTISGRVARLRVTVSGKGRIAVSGSAVRKASTSAAKATTATLRLGLTAKARKSLARRGSLKTTVKVVFTPATGKPVTATVSLSFKAGR